MSPIIKETLIPGGNHSKRINRRKFNNSRAYARSFIEFSPGARTQDLHHYEIPQLNDQTSDISAKHTGSNDTKFRDSKID